MNSDISGFPLNVASRHGRVALIIPTLNAGRWWHDLHTSLSSQTCQPDWVVILDSLSDDGTPDLAKAAAYAVVPIQREHFDHGATRQLGVDLVEEADIIVFLTQDAVPAHSQALDCLIGALTDPAVAVAYGRQLPRPGAGPIEVHARVFNYPASSRVNALADAARIGIKAAFCSNSFAAYRRRALMEVGGFPSNTLFGEDTLVTSKLLLQGWKVAYCAEACVYHSHSYSFTEEFKRYFDVGAFHAREKWILDRLGQPEGEGMRFVCSEIRFLLAHAPWLVPSSLVRTVLKYCAYKLGRREEMLPLWLKKKASMNRNFWSREERAGGRSALPTA